MTELDRPLYRVVGKVGGSGVYRRKPFFTYEDYGLWSTGQVELEGFQKSGHGYDWLIYKRGIPQLHLGLCGSLADAKTKVEVEVRKDVGEYPLPRPPLPGPWRVKVKHKRPSWWKKEWDWHDSIEGLDRYDLLDLVFELNYRINGTMLNSYKEEEQAVGAVLAALRKVEDDLEME